MLTESELGNSGRQWSARLVLPIVGWKQPHTASCLNAQDDVPQLNLGRFDVNNFLRRTPCD